MVDPRETDGVFYTDTLAWARRTGDTALVDKLTGSGPPPYTDMLDYEPSLTNTQVYPYDHTNNSEGAGGFSENLSVEEYTLLEQAHAFAGFFDVFTVLYPQLQGIDFRTDAAQLAVPVYLMEGRFEAPGRLGPAQQWFDLLDAPAKQLDHLRHLRPPAPVRTTRPVPPDDDRHRPRPDLTPDEHTIHRPSRQDRGHENRSSASAEIAPAARPGDPRSDVTAGGTWVRLAQNRFWLLVPILVLDLVLVGRLPPPLAPGSPGPDIPGWVSVSETVLRGVVFGAPLLMPLSLRAPRTRPALAAYSVALTAYVAAWVAVVWAPTSAWSTSAVGFTALAWTSILYIHRNRSAIQASVLPRLPAVDVPRRRGPLHCRPHAPHGDHLGLVLLNLAAWFGETARG